MCTQLSSLLKYPIRPICLKPNWGTYTLPAWPLEVCEFAPLGLYSFSFLHTSTYFSKKKPTSEWTLRSDAMHLKQSYENRPTIWRAAPNTDDRTVSKDVASHQRAQDHTGRNKLANRLTANSKLLQRSCVWRPGTQAKTISHWISGGSGLPSFLEAVAWLSWTYLLLTGQDEKQVLISEGPAICGRYMVPPSSLLGLAMSFG